MAKFTARDFKTSAKEIDPFELELEDAEGTFSVSFQNPNKMKSREAFELAEPDTTPRRSLEVLIGEGFDRAWKVLGEWETDRLTDLIKAATEHFRS